MTEPVCLNCKKLAEIVYTDDLGRDYCADCVKELPIPSHLRGLQYLVAYPPFYPGDRVECRTGGSIYDGIGTVREISYDLAHGGTLVYPAFRVEIDEPADEELSPREGYYTEVCLAKVIND